MRKGINAMNSKMSDVDVLIEVHDARIPFTGRSELFQKFGQNLYDSSSSPGDWRHLVSEDNPADLASGGVGSLTALRYWFEGPAFLEASEAQWPRYEPNFIPEGIELKTKRASVNVTAASESTGLHRLMEMCSDWSKLVRSVVWLIRFKTYLRMMASGSTESSLNTGGLKLTEVRQAERDIIRMVQKTVYPAIMLKLERAGSCVFSKIDLKDAYLQIPLDEASSNPTVINTPFGLFRHNFLPFGLNVSPAVFQQVMNIIAKDLEGVETYQYDVIVHAADKATHDMRLLSLLKRFSEFNVAIHPDKRTFGVRSFSCLGYIVDGSGFKPDTRRLSPLVNAPSPTSLQELRSVLGALQYYSRFIPNFAKHASFLFDVISSYQFSWSSNHEKTLRAVPLNSVVDQ
ncbi:hypothetical protein T265_08549 [Opisthorchis viverrini]|uniref:Reverse transcriptase domain-containing protein n=1 Tax=Opisthorchis viverrini TaxID=6198 RepID=A0A074ZD80_OPIVI|nr:hypothetical protein T265_08549 [Opisthorchis viverrini]KER23612.1 hypothetical protein T265_08549 [Opisthorchis viverrini]